MDEVTNDLDAFYTAVLNGDKVSWSPRDSIYLTVKEEEESGIGLALYIQNNAQTPGLLESLLKIRFDEASDYGECYICMAPDLSLILWLALNNYEINTPTLEYSSHKLLDYLGLAESRSF